MSEARYYPLTSPQLSIWYTEKMYPGTSISNVSGTLRIKDSFNFELLEGSINHLIMNNDGLRLRICLDDKGLPQQYVSEYEYQSIEFMDFSQAEDPSAAMFEWNSQETSKPFELLNSCLYRFVIIKLNDCDGGIYSNFHHIISDAWSVSVSCKMIMQYYCYSKNDRLEGMEGIYPSYVSFIENDRLYKETSRFIKDKSFWEEQFAIPPEATVLKSKNTNLITSRAKRKTFIAPRKFIGKLKAYCADNKVSPYPLFVSALCMYINRVTDKEDIVIGTPILNRTNQDERNTAGMFINTVPLRLKVDGQASFAEFSTDAANLCSAVYRHQRYPYDRILKYVRDKAGFSENLFDIVLSYQNLKFAKDPEIESSSRWHFSGHQSNSLTIHINDRDDEGTLIIDYDYQCDLYYDKEIEFIHEHLMSLLWHALDNPDKKIFNTEMLTESEKRKILLDFNNTVTDYPRDKTIHQLFEEQAEKTPENTAVIFEGTRLSYRELNQKANRLAGELRGRGLKPDEVVGILLHRSFEMIISILAVLKAGGAYLPLEIESPDNRIDFMICDANVKWVLTDNLTDYRILSCDTVNIENRENDGLSAENPSLCSKSSDLAYIIYTSGTTGEPKGVMIEHASVINFMCAVSGFMDFSVDSIVLSVTTVCFDIFVFEVFTSLTNGACLVLANDLEAKLPQLALSLIERHRVNKILTTPSKMKLLLSDANNLDKLKEVKEIMLGGEPLPMGLLSQLKSRLTAKIFNGYGPTETTVGVSFKNMDNDTRITVGKPISNTRFYILDKYLNPVPIGTTGELYIGGAGLARGYINRPELTTRSFIKSPFKEGERLYRSGDLAKWYAKGEVGLIGRADNQIKINGHRVELDEIKNHLLKIAGIKDAVVVDQPVKNNKRVLCAYLLSENQKPQKEIKEYLSGVMPDYMIPSYFAYITGIPVTANGKIDREKLPKPLFKRDTSGYRRPEGEIEKEVSRIWQDVLNMRNISVNDTIYETGGDSLDVITISSMISKRFKIDLPVTDIQRVNTIRKMAQYIEQNNLKPVKDSEGLCLLKNGGNRNLFFIHAGNGEIDNYLKLSSLIADDFNCWGIKYDFDGYHPVNLSIHELALKYTSHIRGVQSEGPYYLAGWCIGGTLAFEIASILEKYDQQTVYLGLFNSIAPKRWNDADVFTPEGELAFIKHHFDVNLSDVIGEKTIEGIWKAFLGHITRSGADIEEIKRKIPRDISVVIPKFETCTIEEAIKYVNRMRTLHIARASYFPENKIHANVYFYSAIKDTIIEDKHQNFGRWKKYCTSQINLFEVEADHFTLFKSPGVEALGRMINDYLDSGEEIKAV